MGMPKQQAHSSYSQYGGGGGGCAVETDFLVPFIPLSFRHVDESLTLFTWNQTNLSVSCLMCMALACF